ncbi:hypothetical protein EDD92_1052 [Streptomyces sp. TLI_185]|nr:hypothetical protein EDD92_1052 [Streptomyces sp. TLI_185]
MLLCRRTPLATHMVVQALPLSVNAVGAVLLAPLFAMKPTVTEPPAGTVFVYEAGATLTAPPDWVGVPPHMFVTLWPSAKEKPSFQPSIT